MSQNKSAKDIAFDKERLKFRQQINELHKDIYAADHMREILEQHSVWQANRILELEIALEELSGKIGIPSEELLTNIERDKRIEQGLKLMGFASNFDLTL